MVSTRASSGRALVLGGNGLVGRALTSELRARGVAHRSAGKDEIDITDRAALDRAVAGFSPAVIYNCAAFTRVDDCETETELARRVNVEGVAHIVAAARSAGARVVHISSDYVFDGCATLPYPEDAPADPISRYGATKLAGEQAALAEPSNLVVRSGWIFGPTGPSFVQTVLHLLAGEAPVGIVADQVGCPTYAPFLARALVDLADSEVSGVVHYRNREPVSWFEFATAIARENGCRREILPLTTAQYPRPARRPAWSVLAVDRYERLLSRRVEKWEAGLRDCLTRLGAEAVSCVP